MRKHLSTLIALAVALIFLVSGCATMNKILGVKDYYTIDMYLGDGTVIPTNLPNEAKEFKLEDANGVLIFLNEKAGALRYWVKGSDFFCDHVIERYTGKDIMLVIWDKYGTFIKGWIYNEKAIPIRAYEETVMDLVCEIIGQTELQGDSV